MIFNCQWSVAAGQWKSHHEQSAAARRLLAGILGSEATIEHDTLGAPFLLAHPELRLSLSHCRTAVAVAVDSHRAIGIDIESRRRISDSLMQRVCTPDELTTIHRSGDPTMEFLRLWTRKEAVLKCRGTGIKGFESMIHALEAPDIEVRNLDCSLPDTVAALAVIRDV